MSGRDDLGTGVRSEDLRAHLKETISYPAFGAAWQHFGELTAIGEAKLKEPEPLPEKSRGDFSTLPQGEGESK